MLHVGCNSAAFDTNIRRILPLKYFYPNISEWGSGLDLDFVQPPQFLRNDLYGTYLEVNAYPKGATDSQNLTLTLYYRPLGQSTWTASTMIKWTDKVYRGYFGQSAWYKTVECYVKVQRQGFSGFVTRPLEKYAETPSYFYQVYVYPPPNPSPPMAD